MNGPMSVKQVGERLTAAASRLIERVKSTSFIIEASQASDPTCSIPGRGDQLTDLALPVARTGSEGRQNELFTAGSNPPDMELQRQAEEARSWAWVEASQEYKSLTRAQAEGLPAPSLFQDRGIDR